MVLPFFQDPDYQANKLLFAGFIWLLQLLNRNWFLGQLGTQTASGTPRCCTCQPLTRWPRWVWIPSSGRSRPRLTESKLSKHSGLGSMPGSYLACLNKVRRLCRCMTSGIPRLYPWPYLNMLLETVDHNMAREAATLRGTAVGEHQPLGMAMTLDFNRFRFCLATMGFVVCICVWEH